MFVSLAPLPAITVNQAAVESERLVDAGCDCVTAPVAAIALIHSFETAVVGCTATVTCPELFMACRLLLTDPVHTETVPDPGGNGADRLPYVFTWPVCTTVDGMSPDAMARKAGSVDPANSACVVVVSAEIVELACNPPPITTAWLVSALALVTQVTQVRVPDPVIVPPPNGDDVATLVTVPVVVDRVPLVGSVTLVVPVVVNVNPLDPLVVKPPPSAIALPPTAPTVIDSEPAVLVTSPVCAGSCAA
jgi:hypothetical protein